MRYDAQSVKIAFDRHFYSITSKGLRQKGENKMQTTTQPMNGIILSLVALGVIEAVIATASLARIELPLIGSGRAALVVFFVIGMAMCGMGMGIAQYGWLNPFNLVGIVIGVLILAIGAMAVFGVRLSFMIDDRAAILAIAALMVVKVVLAGVRAVVS
jgi:hypothetical protein